MMKTVCARAVERYMHSELANPRTLCSAEPAAYSAMVTFRGDGPR
jgi:hypothetical protein